MRFKLVTGSVGFIGFNLSRKLLERGENIIGIDNHNDYYDPKIKDARLKLLKKYSNYSHYKVDLSNKEGLEEVFKKYNFEKVINLAAQAGVRYSMKNPLAYINSNIVGFAHLLENCLNYKVEHLVYASTSSVYGANTKMPFSEKDSANHPLSVYAASKKSNELMAHSYAHIYGLRSTGLRFFTVYGQWGRPDMAMYIFLNKIYAGEKVVIFNNGDLYRDFTYIDDIVDGVISSLEKNYKCEIFNLGNNKPEHVMEALRVIEAELELKIKIDYAEMQKGDARTSFADITDSVVRLGYNPKTTIQEGIPKFIKWYKEYHGIN